MLTRAYALFAGRLVRLIRRLGLLSNCNLPVARGNHSCICDLKKGWSTQAGSFAHDGQLARCHKKLQTYAIGKESRGSWFCVASSTVLLPPSRAKRDDGARLVLRKRRALRDQFATNAALNTEGYDEPETWYLVCDIGRSASEESLLGSNLQLPASFRGQQAEVN